MPVSAPMSGLPAAFFGRRNTYLFIGDYKYWLMTHWDAVDLDDEEDYVLNRARLYRDRRDFVIQGGDTCRCEEGAALFRRMLSHSFIRVYARGGSLFGARWPGTASGQRLHALLSGSRSA